MKHMVVRWRALSLRSAAGAVLTVLCALAERWTGPAKNALVTFGRVPFAFYVPHFLLIHLMAILLGTAQGFEARQFFTIFFFFPKGYGVGLPGVYALWALAITLRTLFRSSLGLNGLVM